MKILAITSWGGACGIANFCEQLITAVHTADPSMEITPSAEALDPASHEVRSLLHDRAVSGVDLVYLCYHRGLHSRWTPERVQELKAAGYPVVIDFHDSVGERPPDPLAQSLHDLADGFVVHEPCEGLPQQILIRQGVPAWGEMPYGRYWNRQPPPYIAHEWEWQPTLGTCGFNFPWKNFDRLAEVTAEAGWAYFVASNNATDADEARWKASNPSTLVVRGFQPTATLVSYLAGCDATCFAYECANSGTSGAIRLGLAARKPVLAFEGCRQMRDLLHDKAASQFITWCGDWDYLAAYLGMVKIQRVDPGIVYLAHRDSWVNHGRKYAEVLRSCVTSR